MRDLIERVEKATAGSWELNRDIGNALDGLGFGQPVPNYSGSIDAALALAEKVRPGWSIKLYIHPGECHADLYLLGEIETEPTVHRQIKAGPFEAEQAPTPAIAILLALLRSLQKDNEDAG